MYVRDKEHYNQRATAWLEIPSNDNRNILIYRIADILKRYDELQEELADYKRASELAARIGIAAAIQVLEQRERPGV